MSIKYCRAVHPLHSILGSSTRRSMNGRMYSISVEGGKRKRGLPSRPIKNFSKFHATSFTFMGDQNNLSLSPNVVLGLLQEL